MILYSQDWTLGLTTEAQIAVFVLLSAYLLNSQLIYYQAESAFQRQLVHYKKLESELQPLPQPFQLKLLTSVVATPDEIAEALSNPTHRRNWDINIQSC